MVQILVGVARFALSAWVGAAALFVIVGIKEVRTSEFDSFIRDVLVAARFPAYYVFGFASVGLAWLALSASLVFEGGNKRRRLICSGLVLLILVFMLADYLWIYRPLLEMITPPGQSRPAKFVDYHSFSKWFNFVSISLTAAVALFLCCSNSNPNPTKSGQFEK